MSDWRDFWNWRRKEEDEQLEKELRAHLELETEELQETGVADYEARYAAQRTLGNTMLIKEDVRALSPWTWFESFLQDVRYGLRTLRKSPGFTAAVLLTLALGIGANTAIFTLIHAVMLRSLPVADPGQLYRLGDNNNCCVMTGTQNGGSFVLYSSPLYENLRDHTPEFNQLAAFQSSLSDLSVRRPGDSAAEPYKGEYVSGNYFLMFGIRAFAGRLLAPPDDSPGAPRAAVMNYHTWQQHFGLDSAVIGSTFNINGIPYTIAGVTPPQFYGDTLRSDPPDFWLPLVAEPNTWMHGDNIEWLYLIGRLRPDVAPEQVQARLTMELQQWLNARAEVIPEHDRGDIPKQHVHLTPAPSGVDKARTDYAAGLRLLVTLSALVLLIACANIANLLLARVAADRPQTALRLALGAPRSRLIRQKLTESVLLALAGGAAGLYVAYAGSRAILLLAFRGAHYIPISAKPSLPVLAFCSFLSVTTGIIFGVVPAWIGSRSDPANSLRGTGRSTSDRSSALQKPLVVLQVAFSIVLLIGAGLVTQSFRNLEGQNFGFRTEGRLIVNIAPALAGYTPDKLSGLYQRIEEVLPPIPGVLSASLSWYSPLGGNNANERAYIQGKPPDYYWTAPSWDRVGPHYFETIGTRLLQGRTIDERDTPAAPLVAVINETFARRYFPNEDPLGQHLGMWDVSHSGDYEIVGIVEDAKYQDTRGPAYATFFLPLLQTPAGQPVGGWVGALELHVAGKPENIEPAVRKALADVDPNLTVLDMVSFGEQVARNFNQERLIARLADLFGLLALVLACVGLYGVTAYAVSRRTNEIGIRIALGAPRGSIVRMMLRMAVAPVTIGLLVGVPLALAGGRAIANELYGVKSHDPMVLGTAVFVLAASSVAAAVIPARRAAGIDPIRALRTD